MSATPEAKAITAYNNSKAPLSVVKAIQKDGKGYGYIRNIAISSYLKGLKQIWVCKPLTYLVV
ncbi:MAG: hypothetical protein J6A30_08075 [Ruminococcus sp.]|nr:hypothetical protein [Ruminococcus sp.]